MTIPETCPQQPHGQRGKNTIFDAQETPLTTLDGLSSQPILEEPQGDIPLAVLVNDQQPVRNMGPSQIETGKSQHLNHDECNDKIPDALENNDIAEDTKEDSVFQQPGLRSYNGHWR